MQTQIDYRQIFNGLNKAFVAFWCLLIIAQLYLILLADESVLPRILTALNSQPIAADKLQYYSYLYHHVLTFIGMSLPLLLLRRLGIAAVGLNLLQLGDWRVGIKWFIGMALLFAGPTWFSSYDQQFLREYPLAPFAFNNSWLFIIFMFSYLLYYIGWECFYRGFVAYGAIGLGSRPLTAMLLQVSLSTIIHIGKPDMELCGAVIGGLVFGIMTYRSGSLIWAILLHFYLGIINTLFCHIHQLS